MPAWFWYFAGLLTIPAAILLIVLVDVAVNLRGKSRSSCRWCEWHLDERPGRPGWWVHLRFLLHRDLNHRAAYLQWKESR